MVFFFFESVLKVCKIKCGLYFLKIYPVALCAYPCVDCDAQEDWFYSGLCVNYCIVMLWQQRMDDGDGVMLCCVISYVVLRNDLYEGDLSVRNNGC